MNLYEYRAIVFVQSTPTEGAKKMEIIRSLHAVSYCSAEQKAKFYIHKLINNSGGDYTGYQIMSIRWLRQIKLTHTKISRVNQPVF
jgi:hypothetical protein